MDHFYQYQSTLRNFFTCRYMYVLVLKCLLHIFAGEYQEALRQLADDIYHSSLAYGTDDIHTSGGYYHMANIFFKEGQTETANSLYEKVNSISLTLQ